MPREMLLPEMVSPPARAQEKMPGRIRRPYANPSFSDIDMSRWKEYLGDIITDSLWLLGARDRTGPHVGDYHGNFVPQIAYQVITRFTKRGELVLDLFSGMGTTLIECRHLGRHGIGVELNHEVVRSSHERIMEAANPHNIKTSLVNGDSTSPTVLEKVKILIKDLGRTNVQHVVLHPPYWDIIQFNDDPRDLACAPTGEEFIKRFEQVVRHAHQVLENRRFMTLVIGDKYAKGEWVPLGFECMNMCRRVGFKLKAINVKDIQGNEKGKGKKGNLWKYRALKQGFYVFKHEYIMIFQKV
ncbi:MAG: DNA methyltransferase [Candidatus Eremiobacteraeota bacterium]|nr:DNA methyltransferase [Candidatus Eremiobacteraeota bacterium]